MSGGAVTNLSTILLPLLPSITTLEVPALAALPPPSSTLSNLSLPPFILSHHCSISRKAPLTSNWIQKPLINAKLMDPFLSPPTPILSLSLLLLLFFFGRMDCTKFTFVNNCGYTVWPGVLANSGNANLDSTGFTLAAGDSRVLLAPAGWSGRFWARTGCNFDSSGRGSCATGDCGSGQVECNGAGAAPPATLAEFTLGKAGDKDYYDVSLVDGYNLPVVVDAGGGCAATGCVADLNRRCPSELRVGDGEAAACRSACEAFGKPEFCCSGDFGSPATCHPSVYSEVFKSACPRSYSYAYDDATSTFTCTAGDYSITFCPRSGPSQKSTKSTSRNTTAVLQNDSWLADLATGDANSRRRVSVLPHASLITGTICCLLFLFI